MKRCRTQRLINGQAMVEFVIVSVPLLLLILAAIQFALIYNAKITLNYAAFETARAGSLTGARMIFMENAFTRALSPLYTTPFRIQPGGGGDDCNDGFQIDLDNPIGQATNARALDISHVECGRGRVRRLVDRNFARIVLVNPSPNSFLDYQEPFELVKDSDPSTDSILSGRPTIPNDNLMYRDASPGLNSLQSIQDANLIKVHVSVCYELMVPLVDRVIRELLTLAPDPGANVGTLGGDDEGRAYGKGGYAIVGNDPTSFGSSCANRTDDPALANTNFIGIPLYAQAIMRMQSAAVKEGDETEMACAGYCP